VSALASVVSSRDDGQGSEEELSVEELVSEEVAAEAAAPNGQAESLGAPEPSENGGGEPDE
jgi:hypothetical protein